MRAHHGGHVLLGYFQGLIGAAHNGGAHFMQVGSEPHGLVQNRHQGARHKRSLRAAIAEHEGIVLCRQQRVDRHRYHTRIKATQKGNRPIHCVLHQQQNPLFTA